MWSKGSKRVTDAKCDSAVQLQGQAKLIGSDPIKWVWPPLRELDGLFRPWLTGFVEEVGQPFAGLRVDDVLVAVDTVGFAEGIGAAGVFDFAAIADKELEVDR